MKTYRGSEDMVQRILNLGTRWRWVVSFTLQSALPPEKIPSIHWLWGWV